MKLPDISFHSINDRLSGYIALFCAFLSLVSTMGYKKYDMDFLFYTCLIACVIYFVIFIMSLKGFGIITHILLRTMVVVSAVYMVIGNGWGYGYELYILGVLTIMFFDIRERFGLGFFTSLFASAIFIFLFFYVKETGYCYYDIMPAGISDNKNIYLLMNIFLTVFIVVVYQQYFNADYYNSVMLVENERRHYRHLADYDALTDLLNRQSFYRIVSDKFLSNKVENEAGIMIFDIDFFKKINDKFGHDVGDVVLSEFSKILDSTPRSCMVARWGGEEFVLFSQNLSYDSLCEIIQDIRTKIAEFDFGIEDLKVSISVGGVHGKNIVDDIDSFDKILNRADENLYYCKNNGRNMIKIDKIFVYPYKNLVNF
ncbi:MAG: GGDEF domain-containing protein [Campylobacter sp.]|nr:GGDEF domain-containing protein [Campylobacter sp.]